MMMGIMHVLTVNSSGRRAGRNTYDNCEPERERERVGQADREIN